MKERGGIADPHLTYLLFACSVQKLGGNVTITQADVDEVAFNTLNEKGLGNGPIEYTLKLRERSS